MSESFAPYIEAWKRRIEDGKLRRREAIVEARSIAVRCADLLVSEYGAKRVWLFGSLLREDRFDPGFSDVDIAVEGLSGDFWNALSAVASLAHPLRVDVREIEGASPEIRESILEDGEVLRDSRS